MNEEARELAEKWGCTPSNTCYWYCVGAAQCEIDDDEDILCRSLELGVGESSGRAGSPERLAVVTRRYPVMRWLQALSSFAPGPQALGPYRR